MRPGATGPEPARFLARPRVHRAAQPASTKVTISLGREKEHSAGIRGEQAKLSFLAYPFLGASNLSPDGVVIPFADGHQRHLPHPSERSRARSQATIASSNRLSFHSASLRSCRAVAGPGRSYAGRAAESAGA
ncbi:hypothetical protein B4N89_45690 [Embleya scabrispora]|uniref:Uncharacterized protein n=1 Tax=Embleya scabrispora TaxID=159449 RepID=A0A1T3NJ00_9ACTN|nr:hypothetical protein B4N89_45690 [Embleya scabrispora]